MKQIIFLVALLINSLAGNSQDVFTANSDIQNFTIRQDLEAIMNKTEGIGSPDISVVTMATTRCWCKYTITKVVDEKTRTSMIDTDSGSACDNIEQGNDECDTKCTTRTTEVNNQFPAAGGYTVKLDSYCKSN